MNKKISKVLFSSFTFIVLSVKLVNANTLVTKYIPTSSGNRYVTYVEIDTINNWDIRALTAMDSFGRASATIEEFRAESDRTGSYGRDSIIFPVNFFVTATHEIIGGIFSQNRMLNGQVQPWFNMGIGFDENNIMSFFEGNNRGRYLYTDGHFDENGRYVDGIRLPYVTAFNNFPWLVINGQRTPHRELQGATIQWQNGRVRRAFMGQRTDGTFLVGIVDGTNIEELRDIVQYLNLVNAVNIDGGASATIVRNGSIVIPPGRNLANVMVLTKNENALINNQDNSTTTKYPKSIEDYNDNYSTDNVYDENLKLQNRVILDLANHTAMQLNISNSLVRNGILGEGYINQGILNSVIKTSNSIITWILSEENNINQIEQSFFILFPSEKVANIVMDSLNYVDGTWIANGEIINKIDKKIIQNPELIQQSFNLVNQLNENNSIVALGNRSWFYINDRNIDQIINKSDDTISWTLTYQNNILRYTRDFSTKFSSPKIADMIFNTIEYTGLFWTINQEKLNNLYITQES
ncbi:MAG: phosphodiester glycosidase family protein [Defluviitaleaceae bacterium]|nr:phosphodiester glycosidase family protein [Defluviitaleaceae bacterium]